MPLGAHIAFDGWLAAIGLVGAVVLGVVIAVPIAWFNLSSHLAHALQSESRTGTISRAAQRLRHGFIVAQIALAFVLLAGAALLGLSLKKVMAVSPGFRADHVLTGECNSRVQLDVDAVLSSIACSNRSGSNRESRLLERSRTFPLSGESGKTAVTPKGYVPPAGSIIARSLFLWRQRSITSQRSGLPLREGRFLTSADSHRPERVCVVDEDFARRYWPNGGALGQRVFQGSDSDDAKLFTIVGVVGAVKQAELTEPQGQGAVYLPLHYFDGTNVFVVTRTSQRPEAFAETLRKLVRAAQS